MPINDTFRLIIGKYAIGKVNFFECKISCDYHTPCQMSRNNNNYAKPLIAIFFVHKDWQGTENH